MVNFKLRYVGNYRTIANALGIKYDNNFWCEEEQMHLVDTIEQWFDLVRQAAKKGINWAQGDYRPRVVKNLINM
jgi:hypothetical protein